VIFSVPVGVFSLRPMEAGKNPTGPALAVEGAHEAACLVHHQPHGMNLRRLSFDVGDEDPGAGAIHRLSRIELHQQTFIHVELFGQELGRAGVGQLLQCSLLLEIVGDLGNERSPHVLGRDDVLGHHRLGRARGELRPGRRVELAAVAEAVLLLERAQRIDQIPALAAIDRAGRKAGAVEQHLRRDQGGARFLRLRTRKVGAVGGRKGQLTRRRRTRPTGGGQQAKRKSKT
jgi:hypothetical protein